MTIKEIAELCGVSPATVSNVLNNRGKTTEETNRRVLEIIEKTGYQPSTVAKNLRAKSTRMIGIIVEDLTIFSTPSIVEGIMKCCEEHGYGMILCSMRLYARWQDQWFHKPELYNQALDDAIHEIESVNMDGIIYVAGHGRRIEGIRKRTNLPVVMAYSIAVDSDIPSVIIDDVRGGYLAAMKLIEAGHTKIGVLGGEEDNLHTIFRMQGFQKACYEAKLLHNPDFIYCTRWTRKGGYDGAKKLLKEGITGLFCMSDLIATGVYDYLHENGLEVGKDLSVVGYDNREMGEFLIPGLTTVAIPLVDIGYTSAKRLLNMLSGEASEGDFDEKVPPTVLERASVRDIC